jgi:hypothetical protein
LDYEYIKEYVGDIDAFLEKFETDWAESVNYDKQKGIIKNGWQAE